MEEAIAIADELLRSKKLIVLQKNKKEIFKTLQLKREFSRPGSLCFNEWPVLQQ
jgi:hypothetical protein